MTHNLKTWISPFRSMRIGMKRFEFRKDDRGFEVEDVLNLQEWDEISGEYTGESIKATVTYVLKGPKFGVPDGYCVMSVIIIDSSRWETIEFARLNSELKQANKEKDRLQSAVHELEEEVSRLESERNRLNIECQRLIKGES